jgi:orotate phosphoribosyltransferase
MTEIAEYKKQFIDLMLECNVLTFGDFTTKSGRKTPFFINSGNFNNGRGIWRLAKYYAVAMMERLGGDFDNLYGPAYKGIPLASTTSAALYREFNKNVTYTFNRKEVKDHGEGGSLVGYKYSGGEKVVIIEDVVTAGTSVRESMPILKAAAPNVNVCALVVSVDRQEKGTGGETSALQELKEAYGFEAFSIVTLDEVVAYLSVKEVDGTPVLGEDMLKRIADYRVLYGA